MIGQANAIDQVTDGPNGARGGDFWDGKTAACFPACVSLAATFNPDLSEEIGRALAQEAQTKGAYVVLGPTVCGHRSPLGKSSLAWIYIRSRRSVGCLTNHLRWQKLRSIFGGSVPIRISG